jgi:hypothetical protein
MPRWTSERRPRLLRLTPWDHLGLQASHHERGLLVETSCRCSLLDWAAAVTHKPSNTFRGNLRIVRRIDLTGFEGICLG